MSVGPNHHVAPSRRPYLYLVLVPIVCLLGWAVLILVVRQHLSESALYRALDMCLYLSAFGALILVAIPIRFHKSASLVKLGMVSLLCGLFLACVTFVGYMTVGFG